MSVKRIVFAVVLSVYVAEVRSLSGMECVQLMRDVGRIITPNPLSQEQNLMVNEEQLDKVCPTVLKVMKCILESNDSALPGPFSAQIMSIRDSLRIWEDMCHPGPFRTRYLEVSDCMAKGSDHMKPCMTKFIDNIKNLTSNATMMNHHICSVVSEAVSCVSIKTERLCGDDAAEFFMKLQMKTMEPMVKGMNCTMSIEVKGDESGPPSAAPAPVEGDISGPPAATAPSTATVEDDGSGSSLVTVNVILLLLSSLTLLYR